MLALQFVAARPKLIVEARGGDADHAPNPFRLRGAREDQRERFVAFGDRPRKLDFSPRGGVDVIVDWHNASRHSCGIRHIIFIGHSGIIAVVGRFRGGLDWFVIHLGRDGH